MTAKQVAEVESDSFDELTAPQRKGKDKGPIPKISNEELERLGEQMKPVIEHDGRLYYIAPVDYRNKAFTWDPKRKERATGLKEIETIITYHTWGYYGFFKPSIAEVISQIPENLRSAVAAFKTTYAGWPGQGDYHAGSTTLYRKVNRSVKVKDTKTAESRANVEKGANQLEIAQRVFDDMPQDQLDAIVQVFASPEAPLSKLPDDVKLNLSLKGKHETLYSMGEMDGSIGPEILLELSYPSGAETKRVSHSLGHTELETAKIVKNLRSKLETFAFLVRNRP